MERCDCHVGCHRKTGTLAENVTCVSDKSTRHAWMQPTPVPRHTPTIPFPYEEYFLSNKMEPIEDEL